MKYVKDAVHYRCKSTDLGINMGKQIGVAVMDTGIVAHPDFDHRIKMFVDCVNHRIGAYDDSGHGTHVAGILVGNGKVSDGAYGGMAPAAHLVALKILDQDGDGSVPAIIEGTHWLLQNWKRYNIRIVNISVGAKPGLDQEKGQKLIRAVEALWDAGLVVVASAGNYGPKEGSIATPGTSKKIITVGSSDLPVLVAKTKTFYSGCGPTKECIMKPDVVAPGYHITSCNSKFYKKGAGPYLVKSGSSMSTPVVAGAIAMLLSKYPHMTNAQVKLRLRECSEQIPVPMHMQGWGRIHVAKLLESPYAS